MAIKTNYLIPSSSPEELKTVLLSVDSDWGDVNDESDTLKMIPLKGAMTNKVFQIDWPTKSDGLVRKVMVRIYREGVGVFAYRDEEIRTFECMSKHGLGPRLLGRFSDGRVEEFIRAVN